MNPTIQINRSGDWKKHAERMQEIPGVEMMGTVIYEGVEGALVILLGKYYQVTKVSMTQLNGHKVRAALRACSVKTTVYLDDETALKAKKLGGGNLSKGIRLAFESISA